MPMQKAPLPARPNVREEELLSDLALCEALEGAQDEAVSGRLFSGQEAVRAAAPGTEMRACFLRGCALSGADLRGASFVDVVFARCDFSNARLSQAFFQRVRFVGCKLLGADASEARLRGVEFTDCQMRLTNLTQAKLQDVSFSRCDLAEAALREMRECRRVSFADCDFTRAELAGTLLSGLDLRGCVLRGAVFSQGLPEVRGAVLTPLQALDLLPALGVILREEGEPLP